MGRLLSRLSGSAGRFIRYKLQANELPDNDDMDFSVGYKPGIMA